MTVNSLTAPLLGLEDLLVASPTFRASVGAADPDLARQRVHWLDLWQVQEAFPARDRRPCAILLTERHSYAQIGVGAQVDLGASGAVAAIFVRNADPGQDNRQLVLGFATWLGGILDDVAELVGRGDYFPFRAIELVEGPVRAALEERASDDYFVAAVTFDHDVSP